jgi:hypothetical protein
VDLIARTITTPGGLFRLSCVVSGLTTIGILWLGVPPGVFFLVTWGHVIITSAASPWAERRLGRRY